MALRRLVPLAVLLLGCVAAVGSLAVASIARSVRAQSAQAALEAEFAALHAEGLLPTALTPGSLATPELERARRELEELVGRVYDTDEIVVGLAFGAPGLLDLRTVEEALGRIEPGLEARADLLAGFESLPDELWSAAAQPYSYDGIPDARGVRAARPAMRSLRGLRATTNLLCAKAWYCARETDGGAEAGRWLARAVALLRLGDSGDAIGLMVRSACETLVLDRVERLCAESSVDAEALRAPVRAAFARGQEDDPLRGRLARELITLEARYRAALRTSEHLPTGPERHLALEELLVHVRLAHGLLADDLEARRAELAELEGHDASPHGEWSIRLMAQCLGAREALAARVL